MKNYLVLVLFGFISSVSFGESALEATNLRSEHLRTVQACELRAETKIDNINVVKNNVIALKFSLICDGKIVFVNYDEFRSKYWVYSKSQDEAKDAVEVQRTAVIAATKSFGLDLVNCNESSCYLFRKENLN